MINSLLEEQHASKYYALKISSLYISDKDYIPGSEIFNLLKIYIDEEIKTIEWKDISDKLTNDFKSGSSNSNELDTTINKFQNDIKTWNDILKFYVLVAMVSDICSKYDTKIVHVNKCIDACTDKMIINWIILHGGWNSYVNFTNQNNKKKQPYNPNIITRRNIIFGGIALTGLLGIGMTIYYLTGKTEIKTK